MPSQVGRPQRNVARGVSSRWICNNDLNRVYVDKGRVAIKPKLGSIRVGV